MTQELCMPYLWESMDYLPKWEGEEDEETGQPIPTRYGTRKFRIFIFGHNQHNENVAWIVEDYMPHLYIRFENQTEDDKLHEHERAPYILDALNKNLLQCIKEKPKSDSSLYTLGKLNKIIEGYIPEDRRPMFYYKETTHRIYKVFFRFEVSMILCYKYLQSKKIKMEDGSVPGGFRMIEAKTFHDGGSDRVPIVEKLMVEKKLERCSWMFATARESIHSKLTTCAREYVVPYNNLQLLQQQYAIRLGYPKPCTVSFDAEMASAVFTRFPKAARLSDPIYAIVFRHRVYSGLNCKNPKVVNYLIVIWDVKQYGELMDFNLPENQKTYNYGRVEYIYCIDEEEFLYAIFKLLIELDPTFLISYNGLGFDWEYIEQRCEVFGVKVPNMSRLIGHNKSQFRKKDWKRFKSTWPQYMGRVDVDMLYIIQLQIKFNSYKLKDVSKALLSHDKVDLKYKDQFRYYFSKDIKGMNLIMDYLLTDGLLPEMLYDKLSTAVYLHTNASVMRVNPFQLYTEGQSIRCVCQLYSDVVENGMYIDSRTIWQAGKYIGGLVLDQIPGVYDDVLTWDFTSLYPSRMKADNVCYTSKIDEDVDGDKYKDEDCHVVEGEVPIVDKKTKVLLEMKRYKFRYIKKGRYVGLLPRIVTRLNALRAVYNKEKKKCLDMVQELKGKLAGVQKGSAEYGTLSTEITHWDSEAKIWDVKQMAVKVSANSMYGFMGMKTGKYSFIEGGMSTTISARHSLELAISTIVKDWGAKIVYGDTDSIMVQFPPGMVTSHNYQEMTVKISKHISDQFPEEVNMAFENFFKRFFTITKKRYGGLKIDKDNPHVIPTEKEIAKNKLLYLKGLITVRGNSCGIVYENFNPIFVKMLLKVSVQELFDYIHMIALKIMRRDYPLTAYTFVQRLGANYKKPSQEMAVFSDCLRQVGRMHKPGEELEYVYSRTMGDCLKGYKMQAPDLFIENDNVLDTLVYITHKLAKPVEQLLCCVYDDSVLKNYEKKMIRPRKPTSVQKVTPHWHLELYIRRYVAGIHHNWIEVQNHIKCLRKVAEDNGWIKYVHDDERVKRRYDTFQTRYPFV